MQGDNILRILLIPSKCNYPSQLPHLGFIGQGFPYLAGALKAAGHQVFGLNIGHLWIVEPSFDVLKQKVYKAIEEYQPDLIGVGGLTADYRFIRDTISICRLKAEDIPIVCGGKIITYDAEYIFSNLKPDFALIGDAEESLVQLADALSGEANFSKIPNLWYWENGCALNNSIAYSSANLDEYAFPDYEPFDIQGMWKSLNQMDDNAYSRKHPRPIQIGLGRSCPFKCTFCCHIVGPEYRSRSVRSVIAEIKELYDRYQFNILRFTDELFSFNKEKVYELCDFIRELNYDFDWKCTVRAADVNRYFLKTLKASGCNLVGVGLESGSPAILRSMKKPSKLKYVKHAIELANEVGIGMGGSFIFGDPAETPQTIAETIQYCNDFCDGLNINFGYVFPYPGSKLFDDALKNGIIENKQSYYSRLTAGTGQLIYNLTSIPTDYFRSLADPFIQDPYTFSKKVVATAKCLDQYCVSDLARQKEWRRIQYNVNTTCPYCLKEIEYLYPLPPNASGQCYEGLMMCMKCSKQFKMQILVDIQDADFSSEYWNDNILPIVYPTEEPILLNEYKGFNLVYFQYKICAVKKDLGSLYIVTLKKEQILKYSRAKQLFYCDTLDEARLIIDRVVPGGEKAISVGEQPILLYSYKEYNLVKFKEDIYGLPRILGTIDFYKQDELSHPDIIKAITEDIVKRLIDRKLSLLSKLTTSVKKIF